MSVCFHFAEDHKPAKRPAEHRVMQYKLSIVSILYSDSCRTDQEQTGLPPAQACG